MRREPPVFQRTKPFEQRARLGQRGGGGRRKEGKIRAIRSPKREFERKARQIGHGNLGWGEGG